MITTMNLLDTSRWCVILPIKVGTSAKSRLGASPEITSLAYDFAEKTLQAILNCQEVGHVLIVTGDGHWESFASERVSIVTDPGGGLNAAIRAARDQWHGDQLLAVIPGDLALLDPIDLADVLFRARSYPLSFVRDKDGTGTTVLTSSKALNLSPQYGQNSAAIHLSIGATELTAPHSVRFDVDTPEDLAEISST